MKVGGAFKTWCAARGVTTPLQISVGTDPYQVLLGGDETYRYMACDTDLPKGSDILRVPLDACLTADTPEALAERLAYERSLGHSSDFAPYIDILPTLDGSLSSMPRFWTPERQALVTDGGQMEQKMAQDSVPEANPWALACVNSRANFLDDFRMSLTPVLDLLNHDCTVGTKAKIENDVLSLNVDKSFAAGEEVFISYNDLTNLQTLTEYGFVVEDNPCNAESIDARLMRHPPVPLTVTADGTINADAYATLRQYLANAQELEEQEKRKGIIDMMAYAQPISDRNEGEVLAFISATLDDAVEEARSGAVAAQEDKVVATYLNSRANTLERGLEIVDNKLEDLY